MLWYYKYNNWGLAHNLRYPSRFIQDQWPGYQFPWPTDAAVLYGPYAGSRRRKGELGLASFIVNKSKWILKVRYQIIFFNSVFGEMINEFIDCYPEPLKIPGLRKIWNNDKFQTSLNLLLVMYSIWFIQEWVRSQSPWPTDAAALYGSYAGSRRRKGGLGLESF